MKARAILLVAAGALTIGGALAAPAEAAPRGYGGPGWHSHYRYHPHFAYRYRPWGPVVFGYAGFPSCHWVRAPRGFVKVCNGYPY